MGGADRGEVRTTPRALLEPLGARGGAGRAGRPPRDDAHPRSGVQGASAIATSRSPAGQDRRRIA
jgi:hypothetical protein